MLGIVLKEYGKIMDLLDFIEDLWDILLYMFF
jgi:hypothetical protein